MQIHLGDDPFRMWVRRDEGYESACTVRFETEHGRAVLSLRVPGREDPDPVSHYEEENIPPDALRQGRFVHVLPGGNRRSYALSRLTPDLLEKLPGSRWVELEPLTEFGFRYMIFPKDLPIGDANTAVAAPAPAAPAPAAPTAAAAPAAAAPAGQAVQAKRPAPVAKAGAAAPAAGQVPARPARQTPMAPELAHEALSQLSHQAAIQHLKMEMAKVEALHQRVDELERRLASSQERERDLLNVMQKWQAMD
ncbi:MAG: hypothetical protein H6737_26845 [Alphaproteobacteria bacterium]|nr:hypothetical protein [Alphaproteobacteria bacterium]